MQPNVSPAPYAGGQPNLKMDIVLPDYVALSDWTGIIQQEGSIRNFRMIEQIFGDARANTLPEDMKKLSTTLSFLIEQIMKHYASLKARLPVQEGSK